MYLDGIGDGLILVFAVWRRRFLGFDMALAKVWDSMRIARSQARDNVNSRAFLQRRKVLDEGNFVS